MIQNVFLLCVGIGLLYVGSEWMVRGAASCAISFSIRPVIVGLTVVAFGTSAPELLVSLIAAIEGSIGVSLGNILGSNVANMGLVLGASALVKPLPVERLFLRREAPFMIGVCVLFWLMCLDGGLGRLDGAILLLCLGFFLALGIMTAKRGEKGRVEIPSVDRKGLAVPVSLVILGSVGLVFGAHLIVHSAVFIARALGFSEIFIGLSVVAVGTSLPELAASVVAGARGEHDLSIGNVIGSNIFNICMVMGTVGLLNPMEVQKGLLWFEFPAMIALTWILYGFMRSGFIINRMEGGLLLAGFSLYIALSYLLG